MAYVVNESCIKCKYMDCVEVCPVDCFYEGENMLVIHPDECIDCGVCEPECPVDAIKPDTEAGLEKWLGINAEYARVWPNITVKREPPPDAKEWEDKSDKAKLLSPNPGTGDRAGISKHTYLKLILSASRPAAEAPRQEHRRFLHGIFAYSAAPLTRSSSHMPAWTLAHGQRPHHPTRGSGCGH